MTWCGGQGTGPDARTSRLTCRLFEELQVLWA
jgi:hypothetical protein